MKCRKGIHVTEVARRKSRYCTVCFLAAFQMFDGIDTYVKEVLLVSLSNAITDSKLA